MGEQVEGLTLEDALAWGRARADEVYIRLGDSGYYSAGTVVAPDAPPWPPEDVPPLVRRRPASEAWKDRTEYDPPIDWDIELTLMPLQMSSDAAQDEALARATAEAMGAEFDPSGMRELLAQLADGPATFYAPAGYVLRTTLSASTAGLAAAEAQRLCRVPEGWTLGVSASPA
jgi:hypothetical protein